MIDILMPLLADIATVGESVYESVRVPSSGDANDAMPIGADYHDPLSAAIAKHFPGVPICTDQTLPTDDSTEWFLINGLTGASSSNNISDQDVITVAYIINGAPCMGLVHHPITGKTWIGLEKRGVFILNHGQDIYPVTVSKAHPDYTIMTTDPMIGSVIARQREQALGRPIQLKVMQSALGIGYLVDGLADEWIQCESSSPSVFAAVSCIANQAKFDMSPLDKNDHLALQEHIVPMVVKASLSHI